MNALPDRNRNRPHPEPAGHRVQRYRDDEGRIVCFACAHVFDEGDTGRPVGQRAISGRVHQFVQHVPEPIAELDDDDFARARGFGG